MACKEILFSVALRPNAGHGLLTLEVYRSHTTTHHGRYDSSGRVISLSLRPIPDITHNTHKKQTSMPPAGFKPMIPGSQWPQNHALDRAATGIGCKDKCVSKLRTSFHTGGYQHISHVKSLVFFST
jgi:hypothetical protein